MTYQDFESQIIELIDTELSDECTIDTKPIIKNNGITLHGLVINNGKCNISPTIYLDYYYKEFENGADIDKLAKQVIAQYKKFELEALLTQGKTPDVHTKNYWKKLVKVPKPNVDGIETRLWIKNQSNGEYYLRKTILYSENMVESI